MSNDDPLAPHSHDPNPEPPSTDPAFALEIRGHSRIVTLDDLGRLPRVNVTDCFVVSTGHGTSGPFTFSGVALLDLLYEYGAGDWRVVEVVSGDGFGTRLRRAELEAEPSKRRSLLADELDGQPLTREHGLVRLVVPSERDDALKQVKWVAAVRVR